MNTTLQVQSSAEEPEIRSGNMVRRNAAVAPVCEYRINSEISINDDSSMMSSQPT